MSLSALTLRKNCQHVLRTLTIAIIVLLPAALFGQGYFGTVSGILTDPSAAVIQGAKVTLLDEEKGYKFTTKSDNEGRYLFVSIPPGLYSVTAEMPGFEKTVRTHIKLNVSENPTANLTLKIASAAQSVEVKAQSQNIDTQDAVTGQVVDRRFINDLPLIDRNVMDLTYLAPGVTDQSDANSVPDYERDELRFQRQPWGQCRHSDGWRHHHQLRAQRRHHLCHVRSLPGGGGRVQGAAVELQRGVRLFRRLDRQHGHALGHEHLSREAPTTSSAIPSPTRTTGSTIRPAFRFLRFTGTISAALFGGPDPQEQDLLLLRLGWNASEFDEHLLGGRAQRGQAHGKFLELCGGDGPNGPAPGAIFVHGVCNNSAGQLYDPYSGVYNSNDGGPVRLTPIPNNRVDQYISPVQSGAGSSRGKLLSSGPVRTRPWVAGNLIDPVAAEDDRTCSLKPTPNMPNSTPYINWIASGATPSNNEQFDLRIDHRFNQKNLLSGKYSQEWNSSTPFNCFKTFVDPCAGGANTSTSHLFALNEVYTISPTMLLTTTFGFTRGATLILCLQLEPECQSTQHAGFPVLSGVERFQWGSADVPRRLLCGGLSQHRGTTRMAITSRDRTPVS